MLYFSCGVLLAKLACACQEIRKWLACGEQSSSHALPHARSFLLEAGRVFLEVKIQLMVRDVTCSLLY